MGEIRHWGEPPWSVVVVHGGPGGCGEVAPLAARLARRHGVAEPFCVAPTVEGQIDEIEAAFPTAPDARSVLIGHSWGAWAALLSAARRPERIAAVVLIGCPPFDAAAAATIGPTRAARMSEDDARAFDRLRADFARHGDDATMAALGRLLARVDAVDPLPEAEEAIRVRADVFRSVWPEAERLRASGALARRLDGLACPVVAFHGDHDPHPIDAIATAGAALFPRFRLRTLTACGHTPWRERRVRESFLAALETEVTAALDGPEATPPNGARQ